MIEKVILDYLTERIEGTVLMEVPEIPSEDYPDWPNPLVIIERVGGAKTNHVNRISVALQSYGATLYEAVSLDETVRGAIETLPAAVDNIGRVSLSSCYNHTDTRAGRYRYQSTYEIYFTEV